MAKTLDARLQLAFTRRLVSTKEGRAHVLATVADAESSGEAQIFDRALARVDDPELQTLIKKHRADELRHEQLFRDRLAKTGATAAVPPELRIIDRLNAAVGGLLDQPIADDRGVMRAYLLLQVIEERAALQFPVMAEALRPVDPGSSATFEAVLADERRHLKYCQAIARRYAPSEAERAATLTEYRRIEARAFKDNQLATGAHVISSGLMGRGPAALAWRVLLSLSARREPQPTSYAQTDLGATQGAPTEARA